MRYNHLCISSKIMLYCIKCKGESMRNKFLFLVLCLFSFNAHGAPLGNPIISVQSSVAEGSHILKTSQGYLNGFDVTSGASAGYVLFFDSVTAPADGTVTPKLCFALPATSTTGASWLDYPVPFSTGIVVVFSTTGCFTKAISNTAFFTAQIQ